MMGLSRKKSLELVVLVLGTFIAVLNQTLVTPALPSIMTETSVDASTAQWLTTGFTLVNAIMIPITAFLIDRFSMRNLFLVAMSVFTAGSALAGWGPNFPTILLGRLIQAAGEGVTMPLVMTELMLMFPVERRGTAMGIYGLVIGFAPALGPTAAGLIIDHATWHDLFFIVAALGVFIVAFSAVVLERGEGQRKDATLDVLSVVTSTLGFGGLLYGLSVIGSDGFGVGAAVGVAVGAVSLVVFFRRQLTMEKPMLQVRVLSNRKFLISTIIGMVVQGALMAAGILVPIYLQSMRGFSATTSGLVLLPGAVGMALLGLVAGRMFDKRGPRTLSLIGTGVLTLTTFGFALLGDSTGLAWITVLYTVRLLSLSLVNMPINTWGMNALDNSLMNHGTSVSNTFRQVAGSLGTAIIVSVSSAATSAASSSMDELHAGIFGTDVAFLVAALFCLVAFVLTLVFVKDKPGDTAQTDLTGEKRGIIESIMKRDVYALPVGATVLDALKLFVEKGISAAPIEDAEGRAVGFVSDGDVTRFLSKRTATVVDPIVMMSQTISNTAEGEGFNERLDALVKMPVKQIATKGIIGVDVHADLAEVCRVLGENHLKKVVVLDEGRVAGVINRSDIVHYAMARYMDAREEEGAEPAVAQEPADR